MVCKTSCSRSDLGALGRFEVEGLVLCGDLVLLVGALR